MFRPSTYPSGAYASSGWLCPDGLRTFISLARFQADAVTTILDFQIDALKQLALLCDAAFSDLVEELYLAASNERNFACGAQGLEREEPGPTDKACPSR